jgi:prepilin-type N-terminal cleavage/methylation domain-containing protein
MNYHKKQKQIRQAFSLIELSIVILIIGILVAGVTQSSRLVSQFRLISARNITLSSPVPTIKDLAFWFDAVNEKAFDSQISDGAGIAYWQDTNPQNTTQFRFVQNTVSDQPFYATNGINGLPSIRYNSQLNTTRMFATSLGSLPRENTIFLVLRWDVLNPNLLQSYLFSINGEVDNLENAITNPNNFYFGYYPGGPNALTGVIPSNTNHILRRVYNNRTNFSGIYLNGTLASSSNAPLLGNFSNTGNTSICLGNHGSAPRTYGGFFGEFIIFSRALSNDEVIDVERYLSRKWSIKLSY